MGLENRTLLAIDFASATGLNLHLPVANAYTSTEPGLMPPLNPVPLSVAVDSTGNTFLAGSFYGDPSGQANFDVKNPSSGKGLVTVTGTDGSPDFFVAEYDASGNLLWVKTGGGPSVDAINGLAIDSNYVYVTGSYKGAQGSLTGLLSQAGFTGSGAGGTATDGFVMKLSIANLIANPSQSGLVWARDIQSNTTNIPNAIAVNAGNVYLTGSFSGQSTFPGQSAITASGSSDAFVAKMSSAGDFTWVDQLSGSANGRIVGASIAVDSQGNVITTGTFLGSVDLDPSTTTQQTRTSNGFASGILTTDFYVSKLNSAGNYVFGASFGGKADDGAQSVAVDSQGNIFVAGTYRPYIDVSQDPNGSPVGVSFDPNNPDGSHRLYGVVNSMDRVKSTDNPNYSNYDSTNKWYYDTDSYALKLNSNGSYAWARSMNTQTDPLVKTKTVIGVGADGLVYVAGAYSPAPTDFGSNSAGTNLFVAQLTNTSGQPAINQGTFLGYQTGGGQSAVNVPLGQKTIVLRNDDVAAGLALNPAGNKVYVVGTTRFGAASPASSYAATFGGTTLPNSDTWVVTLNANATHHKTPDDFDGDGRTDLVVYRPDTATFYVSLSSGGSITQQYGWPGHDTPVQGDFDGDGRTDFAVYRKEEATYYVMLSSGGWKSQQYGWAGHDQAVQGDFDGDGKTDFAVYRPENASYYVLTAAGTQFSQQYGWAGHDTPTPGDYDGDGKTDFAVYRPENATFYILTAAGTQYSQQYGWAGHDVPIFGDYNGDGKTDYAVFRPQDATFYVLTTSGQQFSQQWGSGYLQDLPIQGDYDGDGKTDFAVFRPGTATFYIALSRGGAIIQQFGWPGHDIPLASVFYA